MNFEEGKNKASGNSLNIFELLEIEVFPNVKQQIIVTTSDRLELCLSKNLKKAEKKHEWITPFGLLLAVITAFVTAKFQDYGLSAETWETLFKGLGIVSFIWLLFSLKHALYVIKIENIIDEIKTNQKQSTSKNGN